jgi:hypothetical protein
MSSNRNSIHRNIKVRIAIFILRNTSSLETYFQAAFRVQSPWSIANSDLKSPNKNLILKEVCYVIDFAPNRALRLISSYCSKQSSSKSDPEKNIEEFVAEILKPEITNPDYILVNIPNETKDYIYYFDSMLLNVKKLLIKYSKTINYKKHTIRTFDDIITYNGDKYILDSVILQNTNIEVLVKTREDKAIFYFYLFLYLFVQTRSLMLPICPYQN